MKNELRILAVAAALALLGGCAGRTAPDGGATLTIVCGEETVTLGSEDIQNQPAYQGVGGRISSVGHVTPPTAFRGMTLEDLCGLVGGLTEENSVVVTAGDGYAMTFSYDQIVRGNFPTYDPVTGEERDFAGKLSIVVAYEEEGVPIPADADGPLRLALLGSPQLVTDGHWWVKWVERVEVRQSLEDWTLHLEGAITEEMDRNTFETGAALGCHGTSWTDDDGRTWTGIPLWLLAGRVDDDNRHESGAFDDDLAAQGYQISVVAGDAYSVTLESTDIARDDGIILVYLLDEEPLGEDHWPLRLVGASLPKSSWVGAVASVELTIPQ
jgi:DMSO/TMAO reductase YedYZ molybdopterin-dependent catalytic subunit